MYTDKALSTQPPSSTGACGQWQLGAMSGYNNLDGADDANPGCVAEHCGTNDAFLNAVPVVSILYSDFPAYKYHYIEINRGGVIARVQSWDECRNEDCPNGAGSLCCTVNAQSFGANFLLDVDRHALLNLWGITAWDQVFEPVNFRICEAFDSVPVANQWFGVGNRVSGDTTSPKSPFVWGAIAVGITAGVLIIIAVALVVWRATIQRETV